MPVFPSQGGSKNTWGTELRNFFAPLFDLATGARVNGQIVSADIADGTIVNADIAAGAAIADTKLSTISSAGKVSDTALSSNIPLLNAANVMTANQRVNAGFGVNIAPPATGDIAISGLFTAGTVPMARMEGVSEVKIAAHSFGLIPAHATVFVLATLTGAVEGDYAFASSSVNFSDNLLMVPRVISPNTVRVDMANITAAGITPPVMDVRVRTIKKEA